MFFKELPSFETLLKSSERYPDMDVKACVTWIHIVHAGEILKRRIERELNGKGVSYDYLIILILLASEKKEISAHSLAEMACVASESIYAVIAAMEYDGFIQLTTDPTDMRIVLVELTQEGRDAINEIAPLFFECQSNAMAGLDEEELRSLFLLLSKVHLEV